MFMKKLFGLMIIFSAATAAQSAFAQGPDFFQLAIDVNAERLKGSRCGMNG